MPTSPKAKTEPTERSTVKVTTIPVNQTTTPPMGVLGDSGGPSFGQKIHKQDKSGSTLSGVK